MIVIGCSDFGSKVCNKKKYACMWEVEEIHGARFLANQRISEGTSPRQYLDKERASQAKTKRRGKNK
jgi:hypothetical protein